MKAKSLITSDDFENNPCGMFGSKLPFFDLTKSDDYKKERGHLNYGVFLATHLANRRAQPILDALVTYFYDENEKDKDTAFAELKQLAQRYYGDNG